LDFLAGESEMAALMRAFDWTKTSLGGPDTWPRALRAAVRTMLNTGHPAHIFWGEDGAFLYNDGFFAAVGPEHEAHLGRPGREVAASMWHVLGPQIEQVMRGGPPTWHENQLIPLIRYGQREDRYWTYSYGPIDDPDAPRGIGGVLGLSSLTTATVVAEQRMAEHVKRQNALFQQAPGFMAMLRGPEHRFEFTNAAYVRLIGGRNVVGLAAAEALPESVEQGFVDRLDTVFRTGEPFAAKGAKYAMRGAADGPPVDRYLDFIYQPVTDEDGRVTGVCVQGADVTDLTLAMNALHALARIDPLTDLPNRGAMIEAIGSVIAAQRRRGGAFSLLYIDLDGFKRLNDRHGHGAGDEALREVAAILKRTLRQDDEAGRLGGDEFVVVVAGDAAQARETGERLRRDLGVQMRTRSWRVTASVGAATFASPPESVDAALATADALMYAAKTAGGDRLVTD
jgi:diguanylate cyclase (GGDEF)-like protein